MKIQGGYVLIARQYDQSAIAQAPPLVQIMFLWLLRHANHSDRRCFDRVIKRGQCFTSYNQIQEGVSWMVGYRKMKPTKYQCENAMKWLRKATMVATQKTTRGFIVTICNYDRYQGQKNYKRTTNATTETTRAPQSTDTINKHYKHLNIETNKEKALSKFQKPSAQAVSEYAESIGFQLDGQRFVDFYEAKGWLVGKNKMRNWRAAVRTWKARSGKEGKYENCQRPASRAPRRRDYTHLPQQGNGSGAGPPAGVTVLKA